MSKNNVGTQSYTLRLAAIFSAGKFIAFGRGELARRLKQGCKGCGGGQERLRNFALALF
jgi:hypothetical protein